MEEDDMDFTPTHSTSSKLASLFGINKSTPAENPSLIYTAPKQPRKEPSPSRTPPNEASKPTLGVIFTKGVQAYKLENGSYVSQGTVGITIIGSYSSHIYQIIIYDGNKRHISKTRITRNFAFIVSDNNYASFYDDARQNWSVLFPTLNDVQQFARQIAISKCNSNIEPLKDILIQDLTTISSPKIEDNNSVDLSYAFSVIVNDEVSLPKEKSSKCIQVTENNNLPWVKGLIGCSEKCKRVIILPYLLSAPWTSQIPQNSNILLEVDIEKIYSDKISLSPKPKVEDSADSPIDSSAEESTIRARGASIKEALSNTKSHKANLISRMARMGQATLPLKGAIPCGPSDSEEESPSSSSPKVRVSRNRTPAVVPNPQPTHIQDPVPINQSVAVYQNDLTWQQPQLMRSGVNVAYQQLIPVSTTPLTSPTTDSALSVYISESRTQATELRMGISKVSDKVDQVLNKLQNLNISAVEQKTSQTSLMDPTGILSSIQALVSENESLKNKLEEQKGKIEQQNDRIFNLLELNHKYLEQSSASQSEKERKTQIESDNHLKVKSLEEELKASQETNRNFQEKNQNLQDNINQLNSNITEKDANLSKLQSELLDLTNLNKQLEKDLSEFINSNKTLEAKNFEHEQLIESLKSDFQTLKNKNEELQNSLVNKTDNKDEIERLSTVIKQLNEEKQIMAQKLQLKNEPQGGNFIDDIKKVMNGVYRNLQPQFENDNKYLGSQIKAVIGTTIRDVTLEYLELKQGQQDSSKPEIKESKPAQEEIKKPKPEELKIPAPIAEEAKKSEPITPQAISEKIPEAPSNEPEKLVEKVVEEPEIKPVDEPIKADPVKPLETKPIEEPPKTETRPSPKESESEKSYDQSWRPSKPPPPPLFDDDDDDDDWLK